MTVIRLAAAEPGTAWSPIDSEGWPKGETAETLRGLPRCTERLSGQPGERITCRPMIGSGGTQIAYATDWTTGLAFGSSAVTGGATAWGHELAVAITRRLQLGGRYEMIGLGTDPVAVGPTAGFGHHLFALARYRHFTDEVTRSAWSLSVAGGWGFHHPTLGGNDALARIAVSRDAGLFINARSALTASFELAYERALGAVPLQQLVASAKFGFELGIREPANIGSASRPQRIGYSVRAGFLGMPGHSMGLDGALGLGGGPLGLEFSVGHMFGTDDQGKLHGLDGAQWSVLVGPRVRWSVLYVQGQVGLGWTTHMDGPNVDRLAQGEFGVEAPLCAMGVDAGVWVRRDFDAATTLGGLLFRVGGHWSRGGHCNHRDPPTLAYEPRPPPPPPPQSPEPVAPPAPPSPPSIASPPVVVAPPPVVVVRPVVIDVELGVVIGGGALRIAIDPRLLPLDRLRGAGVTVELFGPPSALASLEVELHTQLSRRGVTVAGWTRIATDSPRLRARFTISPSAPPATR